MSSSIVVYLTLLQVWKPNMRSFSWTGSSKGIIDCFFTNDESKLLVCGTDGSVQFWDLNNELLLATIESELCLTCIDLATSNGFLAQGTADTGVRILRLDFNVPVRKWSDFVLCGNKL